MSCVAVAAGVTAACAVAGLTMSVVQTVKQDQANGHMLENSKKDHDGIPDFGKSGGPISDKDGDGKPDAAYAK